MDNLREIMPKTSIIGPYQIQEELGRGFSSVVYLAADLRHGRTVALKVLTFAPDLPPTLRADLTERFRREARAVAGLTHPQIVSVFDFGETPDGQPFLALERLCGQTLRQRLRSVGRLPQAEALPIALRVAEALEYAHGRGIVHRDIKPDNIFLCLPDGTASEGSAAKPKLMDFGISRTLSDQELTQDGMVVGSPAYMSPEQISGEMVDGRADVFSLAVMLAEMLTGAKPFEADTVPAVMQQILHQPPHLAGLDSPPLERVLRKAMAKRPGQRYASAAAFAEALRRAEPLAASAPSIATQFADSLPAALTRPRQVAAGRSGRSLWLGAAVLTGVTLGIGGVRVWQPAPIRTASAAAVRTVPVYVYRTRVVKTLVSALSTPVKPVSPPVPAPRLVVRVKAVPVVPAPAAPRPAPRPARKPAVLAHRPLRLAPSPPVVMHLAATETAPPVVRVSDSRQEMPPRPEPEAIPDSPPRLLTQTAPLLPPGVTGSGAQVTLHLRVSKLGEVTDADLVQSSGDDALDDAALDAVGGWTYAPALHNGRPVHGETDAVVSFPAP